MSSQLVKKMKERIKLIWVSVSQFLREIMIVWHVLNNTCLKELVM